MYIIFFINSINKKIIVKEREWFLKVLNPITDVKPYITDPDRERQRHSMLKYGKKISNCETQDFITAAFTKAINTTTILSIGCNRIENSVIKLKARDLKLKRRLSGKRQ